LTDTVHRIVISGASGLVGRSLRKLLTSRGHAVLRLVRGEPRSDTEIAWSLARGELEPAALEGLDAVVHLAGANIAARRWSKARKRVLLESREHGTRLLCETLARTRKPPELLIAASAVGYYGDRGDEWLDEQSEPGHGFLPELCQAWETATEPARRAGIRVVNLRLGVVLAAQGGALARMLTPFRLGIGGVMGNGRQYLSWIALEDVLGVIEHLLASSEVTGPLNAVAPAPVTNREFTRVLARVLHRPAILPVPGFLCRAAFGELGQTLLLEGARVCCARLEQSGFRFRYRDLESALRAELEA
jgi:uncharacterized protein (TIGR01777 family)